LPPFTPLPLPFSSWTPVQLQLVYETLQLLGLYEIRHSQIGDERVRGISGGQRKRVNIGMELAADPTVLFLGTKGLSPSRAELTLPAHSCGSPPCSCSEANA
jgi:ABC-type multidrug transport system ATPase subunit